MLGSSAFPAPSPRRPQSVQAAADHLYQRHHSYQPHVTRRSSVHSVASYRVCSQAVQQLDSAHAQSERRSLRKRVDLLYWLVYVHTCLGGESRDPDMNNRQTTDSVKYTPCARRDDDDDDDAISMVTSQPTTVTSSQPMPPPPEPFNQHNAGDVTTSTDVAVNGPRPAANSAYTSPTDRTKLIGERLSKSGRNSATSSSGASYGRVEQRTSARSTSRHSIFEVVSQRLGARKSVVHHRDELGYVNKALVATPKGVRKQRRKELEEKFGKKNKSERHETSTDGGGPLAGCHWTFVFDPSGRFAYWWSAVVSVAFLYSFWVLIYRFAFEEISSSNIAVWFTLDYTADFIYVLDIAFHLRTGFLEDGVLQTDTVKLRLHYMNTTVFYVDLLCLLPLDFLYLSIGYKSMLRCFRLIKIYRFWAFLDRTERHTIYPNVVRTVTLLHYLLAIYHWNACIMHVITTHLVRDDDEWGMPSADSDVITHYLHALYWSTLTLTTIGDLPRPKSPGQYVFVITEFVLGLLLFATILGHVANIVANVSFARKDFQAKLDSVKTYMRLRRVSLRLQERVIRWFDYLWLSKKSSDEEKTLNLLPDKLRSEIALQVHLDTLKRVEIFQNTEAGFLCELVLKLRPVLFSPGDYICRKGEVGKEMYIVSRGRLQVVDDSGRTILALLRAGSYFGEISILNMGQTGNRRTASVRSVGYSDLFVLSKRDLWEVLQDYPTARVRLEAIAVKRLERYKKAPLEGGRAGLPRSRSTPGLVESGGVVPINAMTLAPCSPRPPDAHPPEFGSLPGDLARAGVQYDGSPPPPTHDDDDDEALRTAASADITNSMTVSSITSYISESSAHKSPTTTDQSRPSPSHAAPRPPPSSPGGGHYPTMPVIMQRPASPCPPPLASSSPLPPYHYSPYLSPAHYPLDPMDHSYLTPGGGGGLYVRGGLSPSSLSPDPAPHDALLQEISRLRERLVSLETENQTMNRKLSKQHWDVESRLTEIELHVTRPPGGGGDDVQQRESMI